MPQPGPAANAGAAGSPDRVGSEPADRSPQAKHCPRRGMGGERHREEKEGGSDRAIEDAKPRGADHVPLFEDLRVGEGGPGVALHRCEAVETRCEHRVSSVAVDATGGTRVGKIVGHRPIPARVAIDAAYRAEMTRRVRQRSVGRDRFGGLSAQRRLDRRRVGGRAAPPASRALPLDAGFRGRRGVCGHLLQPRGGLAPSNLRLPGPSAARSFGETAWGPNGVRCLGPTVPLGFS